MPIQKLTVKPIPSSVARQGKFFQLLSGSELTVKFYGVRAEWEEEITLSVGDSLKFDSAFARFEVSSEYQVKAEIYSGWAQMTRAKQDLTPIGATQIKSRTVSVTKGEKMLIEANRQRRSLTVKPLSGEIYIGALSTSMNEKMPLEVGVPLSIDTQGAVYAQISPNFERDTVDVRIIEEIN
ncbi:hypothetical protein BCU71_07675 [Vibrio lentus]|uniref:hypothetical protein n=1 Tax=Vibrio lentus TaxID=136468 RepID=UPI000C84949A|nr:hypothetical protein [Vibrio lentus]PMH28434.1 hypothetical protein BCU71_07675 [Vibrio lentus]PMK70415.1 hypothetical protein BCT93_07310 [Vibrio lentus]